MTFAPGSVVAGRFEILRPLGAGGLAQVFAARDRQTGEEVALKALHEHLLFDTDLVERFRRELSVTARLEHPNIVRVFELHEHGGRPFFTMELLRGETLAEKLRAGPLPEAEARRIGADLCKALAAAHRAGVVHRDLKPQNIFLGADGQVKLLDFGLARAAGLSRLTAQSTVMGTPGYVAPEVLSGSGADPRSDVYSLGATLFEMLTGQRAFPFADPYRVLRGQRAPPPSLRKLRPDLPRQLDELIQRAMSPDAEERFSDARQLERALEGRSAAPPPHVPEAMTAGRFEVVVHRNREVEWKEQKAKLATLIWSLGGEETGWGARRWRSRLELYGHARFVEGCSKETAQRIALLCQEKGVPATVMEMPPPGEKRKRRALLSGAGVSIAASLPNLLSMADAKVPGAGWIIGGTVALLGIFALWATGAKPRFRHLPDGDPAVRRILDGIARRAVLLRERIEALPPPLQAVLADLSRGATELVATAQQIGERAAALPTGDEPDAITLPPGHGPRTRDELVAQLLEIAATLDEVLSVSEPKQPAEAVQQALQRLREESAFARKALPEVAAVLDGNGDRVSPPPRAKTG